MSTPALRLTPVRGEEQRERVGRGVRALARRSHEGTDVSTSTLELDDVRRRARAAFLGLALGDALGATVEFMTRSEIEAKHGVHRDIAGGGWLCLRRGAVTDDTEMSLCVARALDAAGGWDLRGIADRLVAWLRSNPVDVGNTVRRGLRRYMAEGTLHGPAREGDGGNGAAVRMVPVALATLGDPLLLARLAVEQAHVTHHHGLSDAACVHLGELVQAGCLGATTEELRLHSERWVRRLPKFAYRPYRGLASGYIVDTMQTVLHFLDRTDGVEDCVVAVVNQGGDADTTGAIAGAIAGALHGPGALPERWLRRLDPAIRAEVERLADRMVDLSPLARGKRPAMAG